MTRMCCLVVGALLALTTFASAQGFPTKPVRIVVPYPAGGAVDNIVRAVTDRLRDKWGTIIVENKSGGGTQIGTDYVGRAEPDGHTLLATGMETFAISPFIYAKLSFDPAAFIPVSGLGYSDQLLLVPSSSTTGRSATSKCWNEGSISSRAAGSAIQLWMPYIPCPLARASPGVRSECAMPRPAVIRFIAPGLISSAFPSLSRCMMRPSKR